MGQQQVGANMPVQNLNITSLPYQMCAGMCQRFETTIYHLPPGTLHMFDNIKVAIPHFPGNISDLTFQTTAVLNDLGVTSIPFR